MSQLRVHSTGFHRGWVRVFGLTAHKLMLGLTVVANILIQRSWHLRRGLPDPWAAPITPLPEPKSTPCDEPSAPRDGDDTRPALDVEPDPPPE
jgi:hypothetical protein